METKMKTKWAILAGFAAIAIAVAIGCDTEGGSTYGEGGGTGSDTKPAVVQFRFGVPVCSATGQGSLNGPVMSGSVGYLYVAPTCASPDDSMYVWISVLSSISPSQIDHYEWTIRNWSASSKTNGVFTADSYDELVPGTNVFTVKTLANQIRYMSPTNLVALTELVTEQIDVTVVTTDGRMASGYVSLYLNNGKETGDDIVFGSLTGLDLPYNASQARPGNTADYYAITGTGSSNVIYLEGDFDTYLALYDANLNNLAVNDDIKPGDNTDSLIAEVLTKDMTYYIEATSYSNELAGNYSLSVSAGVLTNVPNPFPSSVPCNSPASIAGDYSVVETMIIQLTFNNQTYALTNVTSTTVRVMQDGCDFWYRFNDPTGLIPPVIRMGRIDYSTLSLYSEAYIPQSPEIIVGSSTLLTGSGLSYGTGLQIDSSGSMTGIFNNSPGNLKTAVPFQIDYTSVSKFTR